MAKDQYARLPKWAQTEFLALRNRLEAAEREIAALLGETKTLIEVNPYRGHLREDSHKTFLPDYARVRYEVPGGSVTIGLRDGFVEIQAEGMSSHADLTIRPRAANCLWLGFDLASFHKERIDAASVAGA